MDFIDLTPEWLKAKYDEFNRQLFNGRLDDCYFGVFTSGHGSRGRTLGLFSLDRPNGQLKCEAKTRSIYYRPSPYDTKIYACKDNFFRICRPTIQLNGNYRWTEEAAENTLVHEMCHYYTYMDGYVPVQAHGTEFRQIASIVAYKSNGRFTVRRLATAEDMSKVELDPAIKAQNDRRKEKRLANCVIGLIYTENGEVRLVKANNMSVIDEIAKNASNGKYNPSVMKITASTDDGLKQLLVANGYKTISRTYMYWPIENKPILQKIHEGNFAFDTIYENGRNQPRDEYYTKAELFPEQPKDTIPHFRFNTVSGKTIEFKNISKQELFDELKLKFPNWPDQNIQKIVDNPKYYIK